MKALPLSLNEQRRNDYKKNQYLLQSVITFIYNTAAYTITRRLHVELVRKDIRY